MLRLSLCDDCITSHMHQSQLPGPASQQFRTGCCQFVISVPQFLSPLTNTLCPSQTTMALPQCPATTPPTASRAQHKVTSQHRTSTVRTIYTLSTGPLFPRTNWDSQPLPLLIFARSTRYARDRIEYAARIASQAWALLSDRGRDTPSQLRQVQAGCSR